MKFRKFAAAVNIAVMLSSSCTPLFAESRSESLDNREKMLTERALLISEQSINLDEKEQQLNRRSAQLDAMAKDIQARNADFSVREIELDELKASLNKNNALLAAQNQEFAQDKAQFEVFKAEVDEQAKNAKLMAENADKKMKEAAEQAVLNDKRAKELDERDIKIQDDLAGINKERDDLTAQKAELDKQAKELEAQFADVNKRDEEVKNLLAELEKKSQEAEKRIAELDDQQKKLEAAQKLFKVEQAKLDKERAMLAEAKLNAERALKDADAAMAAAREKSLKADEIIRRGEEQNALIASLKEDLEAKKKELDALYVRENNNVLIVELLSDAPANSSVTVSDTGIINWSDGSVRAKGLGVAPDDVKNPAQGMALARRAAIADLQRNLLETIQGVKIDSKTTISNFMVDSDAVNTAVQGIIKGVEVIEESWNEKTKSYTIAGQIRPEKMSGAMSKVSSKMPQAKKPAEPKKKKFNYTGLIIDARELSIEQVKFLHIVDEGGKIVYGIEYADKNVQVRNGLFTYYDKMVRAKDEKSKVGDKPLVVKAQRLASNGSDIVIPNDDADKIRSNKIDFRRNCKVIIVNG